MMKFTHALLLLASMSVATLADAQKVSFEGLKRVNGNNLYFKVEGEGEPIIILQGGPGMNMEYIEPHFKELAKTNKLIFFDPRSTGRSEIPDDTLATMHQYLIDDIEGIRKVFGLKKVNILGHSWGAKMAILYAFKYPDNIKSLVLCSASPLSHEYDSVQLAFHDRMAKKPELQEKRMEIIQRHISKIEIQQRLAFMYSLYNFMDIDKIALTYFPNYADAQIALFRGLYYDYKKYDSDLYPYLNKIKTPTLVVHGDVDMLPLQASEKLAKNLGNAKLVRFDKSGNFPFMEEPEKFAKTVHDFIAKQKP